jgi:hypothetical protein
MRSAWRNSALLLFLAGGLLVLGCGRGARTYPVSGRVTLDGQPLETGDIYFMPVDPNVAADAGKITAGEFRFEAREGKMRVEIRASREVPGKKSPMGNIRKEEYIPARYNRETILEADVQPNGKNVYTFELKSGGHNPP